MRRRLAVVLRVAGPQDWFARAGAVTRAVLGHPHGGWPAGLDSGRGRWEPDPVTEITWVTAHHFDETARQFVLEQHLPDGLMRRTRVLVHDGPDPQLAVEVDDLSEGDTIRPLHANEPAIPSMVEEAVRMLDVVDGGRRLTPHTAQLGAGPQLAALVRSLTHPDRRLPVIASTVPGTAPVSGPLDLGRRLAGLAHVVGVSREVLTEMAGMGLDVDVEAGAQLWWPGYVPGDRNLHQTWQVTGLPGNPPARGVERLVVDAACAAWTTPDVIGRLDRAEARSRIRRLERDRRSTPAEAATSGSEPAPPAAPAVPTSVPSSAGGAGGTPPPPPPPPQPAPEVEELMAHWELDLVELAEARARVSDLADENEVLRLELDDLVERFHAAITTVTMGETPRVDAGRTPRSVREAVTRADGKCTRLVFLPEAFDSAETWQYANPTEVLEDLLKLDLLLGWWADGKLAGNSFTAAALEQGLPWRPDVSRTALTKYRGDYARRYEGREILLGPHLRWGARTKDSTGLCRAYLWLDRDVHRGVVGHVGAHLRGARDN